MQDTLSTTFPISELGPVSLILGMEVTRDTERGTLQLSQHKYVLESLKKNGMESCNLVHSPGIPDQNVENTEETLQDYDQTEQYLAMVGSLLFLAQCTRYDRAFSVI